MKNYMKIILIVMLLTSLANSVWWNSNWGAKYKFDVNSTIETENLVNFPAQIQFDHSQLVSQGRSFADGRDLRILDSTESIELPYEIENRTNNTNLIVIWIKFPVLTTNTSVYVYFNNSNSSLSTTANGSRVFSNNYSMVFHGGEVGYPNIWVDSVRNATMRVYGTSANCLEANVTQGTRYGLGKNVTGSCVFGISPAEEFFYGMNASTMSVWFYNPSNTAGYLGIYGRYNGDSSRAIFFNGSEMAFNSYSNTFFPSVDVFPDNLSTALYALRYNGSIPEVGKNGIMRTNESQTLTTNMGAGNTSFSVGGEITGTLKPGVYDEVRLSNISRSNNWLLAEYGQNYAFGGEFLINNTILINFANNSNIPLNRTLNFTYSITNITAPINYQIFIDNSSAFSGSSATDVSGQFAYQINRSGLHYFYIETDQAIFENRSPTYFVNFSDVLTAISPKNEFSDSDSITFRFEIWTGDNTSYTIFLDNTPIFTSTTNTTGNITYTTQLPDQDSYSWNVTSTNSILGTSLYSETFTFSIFTVGTLFQQYLGVNISTCTTAERNELVNCNEGQKLTKIYNFSAVVCNPLNATLNYTCITNMSIGKYTKNNYTIFYAPNNTWNYADNLVGVEHVGAVWYYSGAAIDPRFELFQGYFIYIPAQNRTFDCGVRYQFNCSYFGGFTINNKQVLVSDSEGVFYTTASLGLTEYNETLYGSTVVNTAIFPLEYFSPEIFENGIFKKVSCVNENGQFVVSLINTNEQNYEIVATGTNSSTFLTTARSLQRNTQIYNDSTIDVFANDRVICRYSANNVVFLNMQLSFINQDFLIYFLYLIEIFVVVAAVVSGPLFFLFFFIINDAFGVFNTFQVGVIFAFAVIGSLVLNTTSFDRGIKHIMLLSALFTAYLVVLSPYQSQTGANFSPIIGLQDSFISILNANSLGSLAINSVSFIIVLFQTIATLPYTVVIFLFDLIGTISPVLQAGLAPFENYIALGVTAYFYLKAYEVIANRFRGV